MTFQKVSCPPESVKLVRQNSPKRRCDRRQQDTRESSNG